MRYNLSSQVALTHVEERLYRPLNAFEEQILTSKERIPTDIYPTKEEAAKVIVDNLSLEIRSHASEGEHYTIAISGGHSPIAVLQELVKRHKEEGLSFKNVHLIPMYEFYPLKDTSVGVLAELREEFIKHVDIPESNIHYFDATVGQDAIERSARKLEETLAELGGIDCLIVGIGRRGSIGMNAPGTSANAGAGLAVLDKTSRKEAANSFNHQDNVPNTAITLGLKDVMKAKKVVMLAWGDAKADMLKRIVEDKPSEMCPASLFQLHDDVQIYADLQAADMLTRIRHPWIVTDNMQWTDQLTRRAVCWLSLETEKPILKLTHDDYIDHKLGNLLAVYGSAYDVNIKIFNDIQHTITGWPGGKPNSDDSNRPERAVPERKRVLIFSPHPDDDVISMGGTFHRLVEQGHDVHIAYQTSGNIAVGDEEVIRYLSYLRNVAKELNMEESPIMEHALKLRHFLLHEKEEGSVEIPEVRFMKGTIRQEEARTACRFLGVEEDHVHFLNLPFYETGAIKKGDLTEEDINIIIDLLHEVKPHQIFVAGDLADPHGTHKVCLDAAFAAIDQVKHEEWFKDCWIWMYRGAWAEWEIDHIEMAVPMSPEQLRFKRNSILKHQSQMESAPFLGDDERLFWQRSEDRNRATAELYRQLGLASYEAIEAFVRYHPVD
ncbi:MAG: 6-phosphogluconolactonase [Porphyromonas sp.]|nr:6-phosphogluconolactonase [Porphyromonas sp.]